MSDGPAKPLLDLLHDTTPDVNRIIGTFITRFNTVYGRPEAVRWDISKEEWQRYEFLGDRVLNLVVAQYLFTRRDDLLSEGEMTRILGSVVSNRSLDVLTRGYDRQVFTRLIPEVIAGQETYGERITAGAFEAFIGALYCEAGLDDVMFFVTAILRDQIEGCDPRGNAIGILQEYHQKQGGHLPVYQEMARTGPEHRRLFSVQVVIADGRTFSGSGSTLQDARKEAAQNALDALGRSEMPSLRP